MMVVLLASLFTVLAILAAGMLYTRGHKFRQTLAKTVGKFQRIPDVVGANKATKTELQLKQVNAELEKTWIEYEAASNEDKKRLELTVGKLEAQQQVLQEDSPPIYESIPDEIRRSGLPIEVAGYSSRLGGPLLIKSICSKCETTNFTELKSSFPELESHVLDGSTPVKCTNCSDIMYI